ncbi:MAG: hypothetical protein JRJ85_27090 [Deltaproteobacteria bacterium]|nr:hypothetical protein [Deltaproteobacteria bacterium]
MVAADKLPRIIFFVGVDGAGKTLYANMLLKELKKNGVDAVHAWSRYNNFLSKPLLMLTRLSGHNYKEYHKGIEFGYHEFGSSRAISYLFIVSQMIDVNLATFFKLWSRLKENRVLVCDRGPYDTIVDVMLDTHERYFTDNYRRLYLASLPARHIVFYIYRPLKEIYQNRPELTYDRSLRKKERIYQYLYQDFGWKKIDNVCSSITVFERILYILNGVK